MADYHDAKSEVLVNLDIGNLLVNSVALLKASIDSDPSEEALKHVASLGAQQLLQEIFKLPSEYHEHVPVAKLPEPLISIPREKYVPKEKTMTKWEKFAKEKGITKKRKDKLAWDDESKGWKPLHGYRSKNNEKQWCMEVPANGDPNADYFAKAKEEKKEKIAKNEYQRLRNIAAATKSKVTNLESVDMADKHQLSRSLSAAKTATASLGRFTDKLPHEKAPKNKMKKRQFKPNVPKNMKEERENNLKIFQTLDKKNPKLNIQEAVQRYMTKPLKEGDEGKSGKPKKSKKGKFVKNLFRGGKKTKGTFKKRS
ncbi:hypothetical protein JTE90_025888 [Oedothorax gibbosus]|uniref:Ribosome biogenesis regulatory protein n=1 Tax=Oedothorax gibbosus TaxID=931172 RepID=A0AAV6UNL6_9ARAC|nr:hypothetical protein JTE90_025888 [Oedothorax gibbosus]